MKQTPIITGGILYEPEIPGIYPSYVWHHGLNGQYNTQGIGLQMANGLEIKANVYCFQNVDQGSYSKNEVNGYAALVLAKENLGIYVFGWSQGGQGVMEWLNHHREIVSGAGIISGWTGLTNYVDFINIPIRAWHGTEDTTINIGSMRKFIAGVATAGGDATMIEYAGMDHNIVTKATSLTDPNSTWLWIDSKINVNQPVSEAIISQVWNGSEIVSTTDKGTVLKTAVIV